jgi:hypothetical protein
MPIITINIAGLISSILAIIFGVIIIAWKKSLNYMVGIYFILAGILGLLAAI